ncbi:winged helix DNA-binding domain-containing protein [Nocardioides hankookensis]|uniref:Winged helix DNA-binding domain-containing protein n=1 Tax=Nocardioides hankookensis TaxID=443157 RepID=A0ABW1LQ57_9ACTN
MRLTRQRLNRTLLRRQHLLERVDATPEEMAQHLVGLQAQETLPPYLSLHARLATFDPYAVTRALEERTLVRLLTMRGTIHLLTPDDALELRPWTQPVMDRGQRNHPEPLPQFSHALVQTPPRGTWKGRGGVVYAPLEDWVGRPLQEPDVPRIVERYLSAFGPASAADVTTWSGVTRLGPVLAAMDLERHEDEAGKVLYDVVDGVVEDEDAPAPVRLLGTYDNLWLSHASRDRVTDPTKRTRWMGANGGVAMAVFVDGWLEGLWRVVDDRVEVLEVFRDLTKRERADLDAEIARVEVLLGG